MSTNEQQNNQTSTPLPDKALRDARQTTSIFILAWKNYGLYPEDHASTVKSIQNLSDAFNTFFANHGDLRLTVEKGCLLYESEIIHKVSPEAPSEDIATLLYRDGIKWIEFQEDLPLAEILSFFRIAFKYRLFAEEAEGDIVTALMDEEFEYIDFKAVDIFWQDLLIMNFAELPPPAPQDEQTADQTNDEAPPEAPQPKGEDTQARSIADPSVSEAQLALTSDDYQALEQMVRAEEDWDITEDLIELLLIMLRDQIEEDKFKAVLGFITEMAAETIELAKFDLLVKLLEALHRRRSPQKATQEDWKVPLINGFFQALSKPEFFERLSQTLLQPPAAETVNFEALEQALHYFSPEIVPFLVPVLMHSSTREIHQIAAKTIVRLSRQDIGPLERMAAQQGPEIGSTLLILLKYLKGERVNRMLFRMCDDPSDKLRRKAIKELLARDPQYTQRLFSRIDDPDKEIRTSILAAVAKQRSTALEDLMLDYLQERYTKKENPHVLACFRALGRCGSDKAVPFLRTILLEQGWNSVVGAGKPFYRQVAAFALTLLDTPEAKEVLRKASKSRFKVVRNAFERTKAINAPAQGNRHD